MSNLEEWLGPDQFPHLKKLIIQACPKLTITPTSFPALKKPRLLNCNGMGIKSMLSKQTSMITSLFIKETPHSLPSMDFGYLISLHELSLLGGEIKFLPKGLEILPALEVLTVGILPLDLDYFPLPSKEHSNYFVSLRRLRLLAWHNIKYLPQQLQHLTPLHEFSISSFNGLVSLPEWLGNLSSLQALHLADCKNQIHMPSKEALQSLKSLKQLTILKCPLLKERCSRKKSEGLEWFKISHIPQIWIDYDQVQNLQH